MRTAAYCSYSFFISLLLLCRYQDPFESDRLLQRTETVPSYAASANCYQTVTDGIREGEGEREEEESVEKRYG